MTAVANSISNTTGTFLSVPPVVKAFLLAVVCACVVQAISSAEGYDTPAIYSGIFDLTTIFTGFLATFYVFVVARENDFLSAISGTNTYCMMVKLLKFTILWSILVILLSYCLMVLSLEKFPLLGWETAAVFFWLFNVFMVAVNFSRCVLIFSRVISAQK